MPKGHALGFRWTTPTARLWKRVIKAPGDGCWEWQGCTMPVTNHPELRGYGQIGVDGKKLLTHILSWTLTHGPVPPGMYVLHTCDNRPCVRPSHLFLGTKKDNIADAHRKGRLPCGGACVWAKLDEGQVREILQHAGTETFVAVGARYGVSEATIRAIVHHRNWKHVS